MRYAIDRFRVIYIFSFALEKASIRGLRAPTRLYLKCLALSPCFEIMAILTHSLDTVRTYAGALTWEPFVRFSRSTILRLLKRIAVGQIVLRDNDGSVTVCGNAQVQDGSPRTELMVLKEAFWIRVLLFADMVSRVSSLRPPH